MVETTPKPQPAVPPRRVVVFGGTFDPPHRAHTELPTLVLDAVEAELLLYVPAGRSPFKRGHDQSPPEDRLAMLELALKETQRVAIDTGEIERGDGEPSYTIDTLERLADHYGDTTELRLLLGTDQLMSFDLWKQAEDIVDIAPLCVMLRPPVTRAELLGWIDNQAPGYVRDSLSLVEAPEMDIASTDLRERIRHGLPVSDWVLPEVERYITDHGLYR